MLWFALMTVPIYYFISTHAPSWIFLKTENYSEKATYFSVLLFAGPFLTAMMALMGFFSGQGKTRLIAIATITANLANIILDFILVFGWGWIPSLGVQGAAIASVFSVILQVLLYGFFFYRSGHGQVQKLNIKILSDALKVGVPAAIAHTSEMLAHFAFFTLMETLGPMQVAVCSIIQSYYLVIHFFTEGISKGVTAIASNFIGAHAYHYLRKNLLAAFRLVILSFIPCIALVFTFKADLFRIFMSPDQTLLFESALFRFQLFYSAIAVCFFFLFDGWLWSLVGSLTAAKDTRFIMVVGLVTQWLTYVLPVYIGTTYFGFTAFESWIVIVLNIFLLCTIYMLRFKQEPWKRISESENSTQEVKSQLSQ